VTRLTLIKLLGRCPPCGGFPLKRQHPWSDLEDPVRVTDYLLPSFIERDRGYR